MYHHKKPYKRVLFITKYRENGQGYSNSGLSSGLLNSSRFVADMLNEYSESITAKTVQVIDNNDIDREVTLFKPDVVFIEALWVVPEKFYTLKSLHPDVKWIVRIHSDTPFAAGESVFIEWVVSYLKMRNVYVNVNSKELYDSFKTFLKQNHESNLHKKLSYLENYYPIDKIIASYCLHNPIKALGEIHISCFGAIRQLKNQLIQALAAIEYANKIGKTLYFHINTGRKEMNGDPAYKNIVALFKSNPRHKLVEHAWMDHALFLSVVKSMDIGMQVSLTETFNIVAADHVAMGVPVLVSDQIDWISPLFAANPNSVSSIVRGLGRVDALGKLGVAVNRRALRNHALESKSKWLSFFK